MTFKEQISSAINFLIKKLHHLDKKVAPIAYKPLYDDHSPTSEADSDGKYSEAILDALKNIKVKNIAITGPYGSGKTSILESFKKRHKGEYTYLSISLASFKTKKAIDQSTNGTQADPLKGKDGNNSRINEVHDLKDDERQLIEWSILQQIFYKVKGSEIPYSRFKRIRSSSRGSSLWKSIGIIIWLISVVLFFKPDFFSTLTFWKDFLEENKENIQVIAFAVFALSIIIWVYLGVRTFGKVKLSKLNVKSGEIEIATNTDSTSILNKYFDEILYFFEETDYNVVIIEDLDRFKDTEIFTKLRELNTLINSSDQVNQRVVFIYAIKDDIFFDKESRTKFFDRIIPVIPVINSSNSKEKLRKRLIRLNLINSISDEFINISDEFINDISLYIDDMRILVNTVNEYALYKQKITVKLVQDKLFGMIVYKNTYPANFALLHYNQGEVYRVFERKREYIKGIVSKIESEQKEISEKIEKLEKVHLQSISELRAVYVYEFVKDHQSTNVIKLNRLKSLREVIDDENFSMFKKLTNIQYAESPHHGVRSSSISFQELEKKIDPEKTYDEREKEVNGKCNNEIEQLRKRIEELDKEIRNTQHASLKEIMEQHSIEEVDKEIGDNRLLMYLIRYGYIDEMYHSYISYFYEGSLTRDDMDFVLSVKNQAPLNFEYKLSKVDGIMERLRIGDYRRESVLNYGLIDHLLETKENHEKELNAVIEQISNKSKSAISFMNGYLEKGNRMYPPGELHVVFEVLGV